MATIIDHIIVELGLDAKKFDEGHKKAALAFLKTREEAERTRKSMDENVGSVSDVVAGLTRKVAGLILAYVALDKAIKFEANLAKQNISLGNLSATTQISIRTLSIWENTAERAGSSAQSMRGAIAGLDKEIKDYAATGGGDRLMGLLNELNKAGAAISLKTPEGTLKTATDLWLEILDAQERLNLTPKQRATQLNFLGLTDPSVTALFMRGATAMRQMFKEQENIYVATEKAEEMSRKLNEAWTTLEQRAKSLGQTLITWIYEPLEKAINVVSGLLGKGDAAAKKSGGGFGEPSGLAPLWPGGGGGGTAPRGGGGPSPTPGPQSELPLPSAPGATQTQQAMGLNQPQYDAFRRAMLNLESSGGTVNRMGGAGGKYAGVYQLSQDEIRRAARLLKEPPPTSTGQFLNDRAMQERYFDAITAANYRELMRHPKFAAMSKEDQLKILGYAHNQGVTGAKRYLDTGRVGADAFGTKGTAYSQEIQRQLDRQRQDTTPIIPWMSNPRLLRAPRFNLTANPQNNYSTSETVVHSMIFNSNKVVSDDAYGLANEATPALDRGGYMNQMTEGPN